MRMHKLVDFRFSRLLVLFLCIAGGWITVCPTAIAQEVPLAQTQRDIAQRFKNLEDLLLRSAELEALENPSRSALLQQAAQLAKQVQLGENLLRAAENMDKNQLSEAIERQRQSKANLEKLLTLLQSENRQERVRAQREKVRGWIEETNRLLRMQGSLRGRTEGGQDASKAAEDQERLEKKADGIAGELRGESADAANAESSSDSSVDPGGLGERTTGWRQVIEVQGQISCRGGN